MKGPKKLERIFGANHGWNNKDKTAYNPEAQKQAISLTADWINKCLG